MNFVYSFISRPKHIFLVHGEEESQEVLGQKIENEAQLPVIIPSYGETYELNVDEDVKLTHKIDKKLPVNMKTEVLKTVYVVSALLENHKEVKKTDPLMI